MFDGSTTGRAFENPIAPYLFGALVLVAVALWLHGRLQIRRYHDRSSIDDEQDD